MPLKNRLRELRKKAGFPTVSAFADVIKKPVSTITSHENGTREITEQYLDLYVNALGVTASEILSEYGGGVSNDKLIELIYSMCKIQKRRKEIINKNEIESILNNLRKYNINENEIEIFIESCISLGEKS